MTAPAPATADALIGHPIRVNSSGGLSAVDNPAGWFKTVQNPLTAGLIVLSASFIGRQVLSWRPSSGEYVGLVLLATRVLGFKTPVAVAASTLAAVALFTPVRVRVQRIVDRRFNRARYDADRTVAAFAGRLRDAMDLDSVTADLTGVVHTAPEPAHVSLWIRQGQP